MSDFNFDLFTQPDQYEETLLRDRKAMVEYWRDDKKAEFVRDVIALANTARMLGKPAYLILGVRDAADDTPDDICGIGEMFERQVRRGKTEEQARATLRQELAAIVHRYIEPLLSPEIEFAEIDQKVVGYVLIPPLAGETFQVSQEFRSGNETYLRSGQCWLRFGESKGEIRREDLAPEHDKLRYCYSEVPYVLPSIWQGYFEQAQGDILRCWRVAEPPAEAAYQELHNGKGVPLHNVVDDFLREEGEHLLVLQGAAGSGKSLFLQRLAFSLAQEGVQDMESAYRLEQFRPPSGWIPLLFPLRDLTRSARTDSVRFTEKLCDLLHALWKNSGHGRPKNLQKLFENPRLHWLILLDGLDEVGVHQYRREFLNVLLEFMRAYPRLRVILTTRPVISLEGVQNARLVEIKPLDDTQIETFFIAQRTDRNDTEIYAFLEQCQQWEDAWKLLSVPAYLNTAITALDIPRIITDVQEQESQLHNPAPLPAEMASVASGPTQSIPFPISDSSDLSLEVDNPITNEVTEQAEYFEEEVIITLPRLLDRVYGAFWERERLRGRFADISELRFGTYQMAANLMTVCSARVERAKARRLLKAKGLQWALEMGILDDNEYDHIFFATPSTQVYSAAKKLQGDIEGGFGDSIRRYVRRWQEMYRTEIAGFFEDLVDSSLSTFLETQGGSNG